MATSVYFNGKLRTLPGAYSTITLHHVRWITVQSLSLIRVFMVLDLVVVQA